MQAWLCENPIGVDALNWKSLSTPEPKAGEVRIRIEAASLNFPDLLIVQNKYQMKPPLPFVPGSEYAGVIEAVGEGVTNLQVGQAVACLSGTGGFGTHTLAPAKLCMSLPAGFGSVDAAAFIMTYATSHHALLDRGQLKAGETVLVLGAAGGVGTAAIQIAKASGARVIAAAFIMTYATSHHALLDRGQLKAGETVLVLGAAGGVGTAAIQIAKASGARVIAAASTQEKCDLCMSQGADATINYNKDNFRERLKEITEGKGPDVIYDPVGGDYAEPAFRSIAWRGRYLVVGFAAGPIPALPWNLALLKGASIVGVFWGDFSRRESAANAAMMQELAKWYGQGKIKPVIHKTMPMAELKAAYSEMGSRGVMGKLVMVN